ncbi:MAG: SusD-like protein P2 [Bacteroides rodentium]
MITRLKQENNMKKLVYIATIASSMLLTTSCVDLTQEPQSFITEEEFIARMDVTALQQATSALYLDLWGGNYGFNCRLQRINVCADDITYRAAKANNPLANYYNLTPSVTGNDADFSGTWPLFYTVIHNANKYINKTVLPTDPSKAKQFEAVLGESYFLRGLSYFYLTRMYGDVPLILKAEDATTTMPRSAVADIYDQAIIPSLQRAVELLPATSRSGFSSTPSKWAAKACLADAYMTMAGWPLKRGQEYYSLAAEAAKDIIDNSGLHLTEEYAELWKEANKEQANEVMFALHHNAKLKTASNYGKSYYPSDFAPNAGWSDYYANESFFLNYPDDARKEWNYMTEWNTKNGHVTYQESADKLPAISKYYDYDNGAAGKSAQSNGITCIYRYADVLLMYAEASTRATNSVNAQALDAIQKVQKRAGYADNQLTTTTDPVAFTTAVFNERGWELFAEMKRWFDLVRLEKVNEVRPETWNGSLFQRNNHYYFPVPYQQIDLAQWTNNPGY